MLRKTLRIVLLSCAFQESCSTPAVPKSIAAIPLEKPGSKELNTSATLVKDTEAKQWPHLKRHVGQLLLANSDTQVLLPAAPPLSAGQSYFPLVSKVYRRQGKDWIAIPSLPNLEIKISGKSNEPLQLVGQDIVQDAGIITVHAFFKEPAGTAADTQLVLNILPDQARIDAKLINSSNKLPWTLRIGRGLTEDHTIPYKGSLVAGLTSSLLPHAMSVVGDQAFSFRQDDSFNYLDAPAGSPGFKILLARDALLKQAELVQTLSACYPAQKTCKSTLTNTRVWNLTAPASKAGESTLWQAAMIYTKQGSFRSLIPIREGETLDVPVTGKERLDLLYTDATGVLAKIPLLNKSPPAVSLPPMKKGSLVLNLTPGEPSFIEIKNAALNNGPSLHAWVSESDQILLSPNTLLESHWPMTLALPAGDYHVLAYNGYQVFCDQKITILEGRKSALACSTLSESSHYSARASISADRSTIRDEQIEASGIRVITNSDSSGNKDPKRVDIPMLAAYDSELGLSMRAFPVTPETIKAWNAYLSEKPDRSTLPHFSEFIRSRDAIASLVLDCPPPGFQLAEYNWIAQSLKPDVLEIFGCQQPEQAQDLLQIANRLQQKQNKAVRLAAASFSGSLFGSQVPGIYLPRFKRVGKIDSAMALEDLLQGHYTLGYRTELIVPEVISTDTKMQLGIRRSDLQRRSVVARVYDQDERLSEEHVELGESFESKVSVSLHLKPTSRWIRVEILSLENGTQDAGPLFTLATSNFFGLDDKL